MHVNYCETQAGLIYDSSFMSQISATAVVKVRVRDLKLVPYHHGRLYNDATIRDFYVHHVRERGGGRLKTATAGCHVS